MTQIAKTAIQSAEERLEREKSEQLKEQVYQFLKEELDSIDKLDGDIRKLQEQKRVHEENIKNVKQGNLAAIQNRQKATGGNIPLWNTTTITYTPFNFYNANVAGFTYTSPFSGKTYIF